MKTPQYDYLIIGQGLAGSLLAWRLLNAGQRVRVLDDEHRHSSSRVAAGLINPLGGLRFNHSPYVFEWLNALLDCYSTLQRHAGEAFFHPLRMTRLFRSAEQIRFYERQAARNNTRSLLGERFADDRTLTVHAPWGGFNQQQTGFVRLPALMAYLQRQLKQQDAYQAAHFSPDRLQIGNGGVAYLACAARHVVFCEGYMGMHNPWFGYLPFSPDKGEILTLKRAPDSSGAPLPDTIINGAHWLLPLPDGTFRFGATHQHRKINQTPTASGREQLLQGMNKMLKQPELLKPSDHQAGVRPATADRQPFLGTHPNLPRLHIFNGFGAHGSLTIPWYSQKMSDWLLQQKPLPEHADIRRFSKH